MAKHSSTTTRSSQRPRAAVVVVALATLWLSGAVVSGFAPTTTFRGRSATLHSSSWHRHSSSIQPHDGHDDQFPTDEFTDITNGVTPSSSHPKKASRPHPWMPSPTKQQQQHVTAATTMALASLLAVTPLPADAAMSGGRMGGSFAPSRSSGGMTRMMAPSRGSSSFRGTGGYYGGGGSRTTIISPIITPFYNPFYNPIVPFGGGVGAISYSRGPGLFDLLFLGGLGWFVLSTVSSVVANRNNQWDERTTSSVFGSAGTSTSTALGTGTSVVQLSVAMDVPNRDDPYSLLSVLDRLAQSSNTGSRKGVQNLTSQVAMELLRRKSSIQSASSRYQHVNKESEGQRLFNQWSVQERSKFEQETVSKFGGLDVSPSVIGQRRGGDDGKATMAVVTLVLSIQGDATKVSKIRSLADVEDALRRIAADVKIDDCLTGAEILWTPQDRSETLSRRDVVADYPELTTV